MLHNNARTAKIASFRKTIQRVIFELFLGHQKLAKHTEKQQQKAYNLCSKKYRFQTKKAQKTANLCHFEVFLSRKSTNLEG